MKVVLFGASGMIGSRILQELVHRGHEVTAVVRNPEKITVGGVKVVKGDITDEASVAAAVHGADAVISAYAPPQKQETILLNATRSLLAGMTKTGVRRLIVVGGRAAWRSRPACNWWISPEFPEEWKAIALAHRDVLPIVESVKS